MMFFVNNPWALVISIIIIVLIITMGIKIYNEYQLNMLLKRKHSYMRIEHVKSKKPFTKRMGIMAGTAFAPVFVITLFLVINSNIEQVPLGTIRSFNNSDDITLVYDELNTTLALKNNVTLDGEVLSGYRSDQDDGITNADAEYAIDNIYPTASLEVFGEHVYGSDELQKTVSNETFYYSAFENSVEITQNSNDGASYDESQFVDSIIYVGNTNSCTNGYVVKGLYVTNEYLVVIALEYPSSCVGFEIDSRYLYNNTNVLVSFVDLQDLSSVVNIRLSGNIEGVVFDGTDLVVVTKRFLDYQAPDFNIGSYNPYYELDGSRTSSNYSQISYIEGTVPSSYISVFTINSESFSVKTQTLLTDYYSTIYMYHSKVEIAGYMYLINPLSNIFTLEEPIQEYHKILVTYDISNGEVLKPKTNIE